MNGYDYLQFTSNNNKITVIGPISNINCDLDEFWHTMHWSFKLINHQVKSQRRKCLYLRPFVAFLLWVRQLINLKSFHSYPTSLQEGPEYISYVLLRRDYDFLGDFKWIQIKSTQFDGIAAYKIYSYWTFSCGIMKWLGKYRASITRFG